MKYIKFQTPQVIQLESNSEDVVKVLIEAALFAKDNNIECDLIYKGYLFTIEPGINISEKLQDYFECKKLK